MLQLDKWHMSSTNDEIIFLIGSNLNLLSKNVSLYLFLHTITYILYYLHERKVLCKIFGFVVLKLFLKALYHIL